MTTHNCATLRQDPPRQDPPNTTTRKSTSRTGLMTLLFGMSLATALPPAALAAPSSAILPSMLAEADPILDQLALGFALSRPTTSVLRGRFALGNLDERLLGLESQLQVFEAANEDGALIAASIVRATPADRSRGGLTPTDLWGLTHAAIMRYGLVHGREIEIGLEALMVIYGGVTAQVTWLDGEQVVTASATRLYGDRAWAVEAARATARLLARERRRRPPGAP